MRTERAIVGTDFDNEEVAGELRHLADFIEERGFSHFQAGVSADASEVAEVEVAVVVNPTEEFTELTNLDFVNIEDDG